MKRMNSNKNLDDIDIVAAELGDRTISLKNTSVLLIGQFGHFAAHSGMLMMHPSPTINGAQAFYNRSVEIAKEFNLDDKPVKEIFEMIRDGKIPEKNVELTMALDAIVNYGAFINTVFAREQLVDDRNIPLACVDEFVEIAKETSKEVDVELKRRRDEKKPIGSLTARLLPH